MKQYSEIQKAINKYLLSEDKRLENYFLGGVSSEKISMAEEHLGVIFPDSYKFFLENYGSGGIGGMLFWGIESGKKQIEENTVIVITEEYRKKGLPNNLVVFEENGDYISCMETDKMNDENECPIVTWSIFDNDGIVFLEKDFYTYFLSRIEDYV